ncbi:uracil-DNA glycosylase family protein [Geoalkalibacter halelectricus]|uniref:uracil-DNA glycosylase family protein n=1 Tax=Geoalkalibacter halelectricus TaxID=2847045 RepID=UPI002670B2B3|nr:uracil-DNA glycosylase family protein [Geoalkalibacter halelectricus]MDO3380444.1 uracil-DNA glycosylase family protein [Geoalkalibacter halelectricus]
MEKSKENCEGCPFLTDVERIHDYVPGEHSSPGAEKIKVLILAEAPAKDERAAGRPLAPAGTSGKRFREQMKRSGLEEVPHYIANAVMCTNLERVPRARMGLKTHNPPDEAYHYCRPKWRELVRKYQPEVVFLLGESAGKAVSLDGKEKRSFAEWRKLFNFGKEIRLPEGPRIILTHHPNRLTYQTRGNEVWQEFESDFDLVCKLVKRN